MLLFLFVFPKSDTLFWAVFALANGPVAWAIYAWRNSLVFHSLDKLTSVIIHISPPLTLYAIRWFVATPPTPTPLTPFLTSYAQFAYKPHEQGVPFGRAIAGATAVYAVWQVLYYYFILYKNARNVHGGTHATSFTYLTTGTSRTDCRRVVEADVAGEAAAKSGTALLPSSLYEPAAAVCGRDHGAGVLDGAAVLAA